jgi:large subunit ribosomal protein L10
VDRSEKQQLIASLNTAFQDANLVLVTRQVGLTVAEITALRRRVRDAGAVFRVTKNRLTRLALEGTPYEGLSSLFVGPTAVAYSSDPVAVAKAVVEFAAKNEKLSIVGGAFGTQALDETGIKALAALPSLDELRAKIIGVVNAPATKLVGILQAPGGQLARVMQAYASKDQGEAA